MKEQLELQLRLFVEKLLLKLHPSREGWRWAGWAGVCVLCLISCRCLPVAEHKLNAVGKGPRQCTPVGLQGGSRRGKQKVMGTVISEPVAFQPLFYLLKII